MSVDQVKIQATLEKARLDYLNAQRALEGEGELTREYQLAVSNHAFLRIKQAKGLLLT